MTFSFRIAYKNVLERGTRCGKLKGHVCASWAGGGFNRVSRWTLFGESQTGRIFYRNGAWEWMGDQ